MQDKIVNTNTTDATPSAFDASFKLFNDAVCANAFKVSTQGNGVLFKVNFKNKHKLFESYLSQFEEGPIRQSYNCNCCKSFLRRYGSLVIVDPETGMVKSVIWDESTVPEQFAGIVKSLRELVEKAMVYDVFDINSDLSARTYKQLGHAEKGGFDHFGIHESYIATNEKVFKFSRVAYTAETGEKRKTLKKHIDAFDMAVLEKALALFKNDKRLVNATEFAENIEWFIKFKKQIKTKNYPQVNNLTWLAAATKSHGKTGFATTATGDFVTNLTAGDSVDTAIGKFLAMTRNDKYMRPTVAPSSGNVAQAEKLFAELGIESALKRRYMTIDEINDYIWKPKDAKKEETSGGIFAHLKTKDSAGQDPVAELGIIDGGKITWDRFEATVLNEAEKIHMKVSYGVRYNFCGFVTAVDPEAKPIFRWDSEEKRNPRNNYVHHDGSLPSEWSLPNTGEIEVDGITYKAENLLSDEKDGSRALVFASGKPLVKTTLDLFPNCLRADLFPVRSTIEAFSKAGTIADPEKSFATFMIHDAEYELNMILIVTKGNNRVRYIIDRRR